MKALHVIVWRIRDRFLINFLMAKMYNFFSLAVISLSLPYSDLKLTAIFNLFATLPMLCVHEVLCSLHS